MAETPRQVRYCLACRAENDPAARRCRECGRVLELNERQRREGAAFLLNELETLRSEGAMGEATYAFLRRRYLSVLLGLEEAAPPAPARPAAPAPAPGPARPAPVAPTPVPVAAPPGPPMPPSAPVPEGPVWLAEQQANLLLYLGAFLIVIATLVFVSASGEAIGGGPRMALLSIGTLLFLTAGVLCTRYPRVEQAGFVFFAVGALMVPLNFVGAYAFFFADEDIDPTGLWLAGSLTSALFYGAVSFTGLGRWYPFPAVGALLSAFGAVLRLADAPPEAYPGGYIALAFLLAAPATFRLGRASDVFGQAGELAAHVIVAAGFIAVIFIAVVATGETGNEVFEVATRWYLAPTLGLAAAFYGAVSLTDADPWSPLAGIVALLSALGATLHAANVPVEAYPGSYIALAFLLAAPATLRLGRVSDVFGQAGELAAHVVVPAGFIAAIYIAAAASGEPGEEVLEVATRWYLPPTLGLAAAFYGVISFTDTRPWWPVAAVVALLSAFGAMLYSSNAPVEAYPGSYIALAFLLAAPATLRLGRADEVLGPAGAIAAHLVVPAAFIAAVSIAVAATGETGNDGLEIMTRWYLPPTLGLAAAFYWTQDVWMRDAAAELEPVLTIMTLLATGAAGVSILFGMDAGPHWYGVAIAIVGWLYASVSEGIGPHWWGQRHLLWLGLAAVTASWLFFEGTYADSPRQGAGVHFAAAAMYLAAARLVNVEFDLLAWEPPEPQEGESASHIRIPISVGFIYAAALTVAIGYFHLLASLPAAEGAEASDLGLPFFYLSLAFLAAAVSMRWWWAALRWHVYAVVAAMSLFVLLSSADVEGRVTLLLTLYAGLALAVALWESQPLGLSLPAAYGFFALLAAWRYYEPEDAYLPIIIALGGWTLYAIYAALREEETRWAEVLLALAFIFAALAPIAGWVRLGQIADPEGFVGAKSFEATLLYQTSAATVALLGVMVAAQAQLMRRIDAAVGASALGMVALLLWIGHFRPENVQAYTGPVGVYLLAGAFLALRVRELPEDLRSLIGPLEALAAGLIMGPSFVQSLDDGAWGYGVLLLIEGLWFVSLALVQRRLWLLGISVGFVVLDGLHYLFFAGGPAVPTWAILAIAGMAVMAAGTAILFGRDRWTEWQQAVIAWWNHEPLPAAAE